MNDHSPYWRSVGSSHAPAAERLSRPPAPDPGTTVPAGALHRRKFLGVVGLSAAVAGVAGCIRKPQEKIVPYTRRPEDLIPGKPRMYATSACVAGSVLGLLVESQDGRPTKIEGNPKHPISQGAASAWAQAEILNLYDPDRSRTPSNLGRPATWQALRGFLSELSSSALASQGRGLAVLVEDLPSPSLRRLLASLTRRMPEARVFTHGPGTPDHARQGLEMVGLREARITMLPDRADILFALDSDFLGFEGDSVQHSRSFATRRSLGSGAQGMNRLYAADACLTPTGAAADHRLRIRSAQAAELLEAVVAHLVAMGMRVPEAEGFPAKLSRDKAAAWGKWAPAVAADLWRHRGKSLIVVGPRQPPAVHALAALANAGLGAFREGGPATLLADAPGPYAGDLADLCKAIESGAAQTLVMLGGNPAYDAPVDLGLPALLAKALVTVHHGTLANETSALATWHVPATHFLEAWGDWTASDGTSSIQQPLIAPLFEGISELELVASLQGHAAPRGYELVRETWAGHHGSGQDFDRAWRRWLHDGVIETESRRVEPNVEASRLAAAWPVQAAAAASPEALDVEFRLDPRVYDGRYANNGWLQEVPDPVSKLTWDNAAYVAPATAAALGVTTGDVLEIHQGGRSCRAAAFVLPGTADNTLVLPLGHGRRAGGSLAVGTGFDAHPIRTTRSRWLVAGARVTRTGERRALPTTQEHGTMDGRPIVIEKTLEEARRRGAERPEHEHGGALLFTPSNHQGGQQWGMSIDLSACIGCNACVLACQAENNIPVVGRQRVLEKREMHWIRVDRYFAGDAEDPRMVSQPMACVQCETAPCESVCPVGATTHSPEGLNDQAYQRCIGTRYCSNNCPYKVRRFNFFQYNKGTDPLVQMQKNPDVTLRFRGVMEKCTYCVQRINEARIAAHLEGRDRVHDGAILTACQQTCPTRAIVFGDVSDPDSEVSRRKRNELDYGVLSELGTRPRTTYLARLRNPNPELAS